MLLISRSLKTWKKYFAEGLSSLMRHLQLDCLLAKILVRRSVKLDIKETLATLNLPRRDERPLGKTFTCFYLLGQWNLELKNILVSIPFHIYLHT